MPKGASPEPRIRKNTLSRDGEREGQRERERRSEAERERGSEAEREGERESLHVRNSTTTNEERHTAQAKKTNKKTAYEQNFI